jgi:hypothetical protein
VTCGDKEERKHTLSSTKTFPFFVPFGVSTPIGVIVFKAGIPSSFSVYTLLFFFNVARFPALFCGFGGGPLLCGFFDLDFETPSLCGFELVLLLRIPDLLAACLDFIVEVREGAIFAVGSWDELPQ